MLISPINYALALSLHHTHDHVHAPRGEREKESYPNKLLLFSHCVVVSTFLLFRPSCYLLHTSHSFFGSFERSFSYSSLSLSHFLFSHSRPREGSSRSLFTPSHGFTRLPQPVQKPCFITRNYTYTSLAQKGFAYMKQY
jgi:hypothetical protein